MSRKALLIAHSGNGEDRLPGVFKDLERYQKFLHSPMGGLWGDEEISVLVLFPVSTSWTERRD
jgi:hypothetical protein